MTAGAVPRALSISPANASILAVGIVLAVLTDAVASTILSLGRGDIIGDTHATPDEFAWLDIGYTALKFIGFLLGAPLMSRLDPRGLMIVSALAIGVSGIFAAATSDLELLFALRLVQGFAGGVVLVAGQAILFLAFPRSIQPALQAIFAIGAVVAPATIVPSYQGWLLDTQSWTSISFSIFPLSLAAVGSLLIVDELKVDAPLPRKFDWLGFGLVSVGLCCVVYVLSQGSRWNWYNDGQIVWLTVLGLGSLAAFLVRQMKAGKHGLLDFSAFRSDDFAFAFVISFVAGAALFGSAYLIPAFAVSVLSFPPDAAGQLLLPSGAAFIGSLIISAYLFQIRRLSPIATVPMGILAIMVAMLMLSDSTLESGADDMSIAILIRGFGLGFLFLSITLVAFTDLDYRNLAYGIGLFNAGRQLGGMLGVAGLQTLIDREVARNLAVLSSHVTSGMPFVSERVAATTASLASKGVDTGSATQVATFLVGKTLQVQSSVIAFETAFAAVAVLFVFAVPLAVVTKLLLKIKSARMAGERVMSAELGLEAAGQGG